MDESQEYGVGKSLILTGIQVVDEGGGKGMY